MSSTIQQLVEKKLIISLPEWLLPNNMVYETIVGSVSFGISSDTSDFDMTGVAIPPKDYIFPHLKNRIFGFDEYEYSIDRLKPYQKQAEDRDALGGKGRQYDLQIYHIVHYFNLLRTCNPNALDSIWTPQNCVVYCSRVGHMIRDNRTLFLYKGIWDKFRSYAFSQLKKIRTKNHAGLDDVKKFEEEHGIAPGMTFTRITQHKQSKDVDALAGLSEEEFQTYYDLYDKMFSSSKRAERVKNQTFDVKFAYNLARLLDECEQLLLNGEMDIQKGREYYKAIRRGDVPLDDIEAYMNSKDLHLQNAYANTTLPDLPNIAKIRKLLNECLEEHYGKLSDCIVNPDEVSEALREMIALADKHKGLFK